MAEGAELSPTGDAPEQRRADRQCQAAEIRIGVVGDRHRQDGDGSVEGPVDGDAPGQGPLRTRATGFARGEAFAYTVLNPERTRCLGCVYLERCDEIEGAQLAFWVTDDNLDMESVLLTSVLRWVHEAWAIERVLLPLRVENARGIALAEDCGYSVWSGIENGPLSSHHCFLSEPDRRH